MNKISYIQRGDGGINFHRSHKGSSSFLLYVYSAGVLIFFIALFLRLFQLTIVKGAYYRSLSEQNRIREIIIEPKRGTILDRKGFVLVQSTAGDIEQQDRVVSRRRYFYPEPFAHLIGYRQIADEKDVENDPCLSKLKPGDKVGKKGVEKAFECNLRGTSGKKLVEVNAQGKRLKTLSVIPPVDGKTIQLAVDGELQKKAYDLIKDTRGAVVALRPNTGELMILTSSPSFNPQFFEDGVGSEIEKYFNNTEKPLFNRSTEGTYPPGSTFKLVVAAGALEEKAVNEKTIIEDTGVIKAGPIQFGNWYYLEYGKTEGDVNLVKAIQRSNDIYFYKVGEKLGPVDLKVWADRFGFGKTSGLQIDESEGLIPSSFWKEDVLKEKWYTGDTYNLSIGQGYMLSTPIQIARMTSVFADNGNLCEPQLIKSTDTTKCHNLHLSENTLSLIKDGMKKACATGGTGWPFFDYKVKRSNNKLQPLTVACKTGTAESHGIEEKPHAWFTVYAPAENPEIVLTVLIEDSGQGSDIAAPIAKEILTAYFEREE